MAYFNAETWAKWQTWLRGRWTVPVLLGVLALVCLISARELWPSDKDVRELQKFVERDVNIPPAYCVAVWLPRGLVLSAGLCAVIALVSLWGRRAIPVRAEVESVRGGRTVWGIVGAAVVLSAVLNAPRLTQGLWHDEVLTMRNVVVGRVKHDTRGVLRVMPADWQDTVFNYWLPNNHVLYSIASRVSHSLWPKDPSPTAPYFSEVGLRLPAYLAGLGALGVMALLAVRLGLREAGVVAVVLYALHPWFVRFSTEARGYSFLLLLIPALVACTVEATRTGLWRWCLATGIMQFLLLYTQPLSLHVVVPTFLSSLLLVLVHWSSGRDRITVLARLACGSLSGVMLALPLMLPLYPQMKHFLSAGTALWAVDATWLREAVCELALGMYWNNFDPKNPHGIIVSEVMASHPWLFPLCSGLAIVLLLAGSVALWRHSRTTRCLLPALLLPAVEVAALHIITGKILLPWYVMIGLPGLVFVVAMGVMALASLLTPRSVPPVWKLALGGGLACLLFGTATHSQRVLHRTLPQDPRREAAALYLPTFNPRDPRIESVLTGGIGPTMTIDLAYDPAALSIRTVEDLRAAEGNAVRTKRPLYINCPRYEYAIIRSASVMQVIEKSGTYEPIGALYGVDKEHPVRVFRFKLSPPPAPTASASVLRSPE